MKTRHFVDSTKVYAIAGDGGDGCCSFRREKYVPRGGPDGGDGGDGGSVILRVDPDTDSLIEFHFSPHLRAGRGEHGKGRKCTGRTGNDLIARVPPGTEVWDEAAGEMIGDLVEPGAELLVAQGGKGGLGNPHFVSSTHQAPREHTPGAPGEQRVLRLELKLAADCGLVGFPNAGKSLLLTRLTNAHPKVAAYPFTTLNPIIGTMQFEDYTRLTIADIPGLLKGAHEGVGLGDRFLRHIERAGSLIFVVDMAGSDGRDPVEDYKVVMSELNLYRRGFQRRKAVVVANKMDLPDAADNLPRFIRKTGTDPIPVSAATGEGIPVLAKAIRQLVRWAT